LITGASDDDPSGIGTYSQAGAQLGFSIGWTMLLTVILLSCIAPAEGSEVRGVGGRRARKLTKGVCRWPTRVRLADRHSPFRL
jgi:hypothetical protein